MGSVECFILRVLISIWCQGSRWSPPWVWQLAPTQMSPICHSSEGWVLCRRGPGTELQVFQGPELGSFACMTRKASDQAFLFAVCPLSSSPKHPRLQERKVRKDLQEAKYKQHQYRQTAVTSHSMSPVAQRWLASS